MGANYVFRPPADAGPPRGIVHFLGGAFVGAAPQVAYGALLKKLAAAGYVVIATPFQLRFDYLELCDQVCEQGRGRRERDAKGSGRGQTKDERGRVGKPSCSPLLLSLGVASRRLFFHCIRASPPHVPITRAPPPPPPAPLPPPGMSRRLFLSPLRY